MLGKAAGKYKAAAAQPTPPTKNDLAKQLFPSSASSTHDGDIAKWTSQKGGRSSQPSAGLGSSKAAGHDALRSRSQNLQTATPELSNSDFRRTNSLVSICDKPGSFQETDFATRPSQAKTVASVYIEDDDFSDDDALQLDYQCPAPLPPPPKQAKPVSSLPPVPPTTQIPWSSSPLDHHFPPPRPERPLKPSLPNIVEEQRPVIPKKRKLPGHWQQEKEGKHDAQAVWANRTGKPIHTPAAKKKSDVLWDQTQSAIKDKRKQLKNQNKKPEMAQGLSTDDMQAITEETVRHTSKSSAISLSSEQQHVLDLVMNKKQSVFFTGPAGTGKSVLMRAIIAEMKKKWARDPERVSVTASTGLAACNIGGQTLHSFAGIGLGKEDVPTLVRKIRRNAKAKTRWLRTSVLIIDEVSMVDGELFDKLCQIARTIRNNGRAWGGIQLVITGDFFQLPPVPDAGKREGKFSFDAETWDTSIDHTIGLTQVFRQKDPQFANMLNEMRLGRISEDTVQTFKGLSRQLSFQDGLEMTELFPTRQEVERSNQNRLVNLPGQGKIFEATDTGDPNIREKLLANMMAPKTLELKKNAQVMLIKNMDDTLVNGSLGRVVGFMTEDVFEKFAEPSEKGLADAESKKRIPAFSRDGDKKVGPEYPVVQFTATDGAHRQLLCIPEEWKVELPNGEVQASRKQLPLILAWALSIHKAQGQTLERVKVDLGKVFEKGQAYVALSRAVSKQGLQVLRFERVKVMAHPKVITFYNKLYSAESAVQTKKPSTIANFTYREAPGKSVKKEVRNVVKKEVDVFDLDEEEAMAAYG